MASAMQEATSMKALIYTGPAMLEYREQPDPIPAAGEVLVQV